MTAIDLLKQTTEYEVLQSFRDKVCKLEQERSYSEEEVIDLLYKRSIYQDHFESDAEIREWFNKFKKK